MKDTCVYYLLCIYTVVLAKTDSEDYEDSEGQVGDENGIGNQGGGIYKNGVPDCWMTLETPKLFDIMGTIDDKYANVRNQIKNVLGDMGFDDLLLKAIVADRGASLRELYANPQESWKIPSGLNLGGYCMVRMTESVLFFHRMKLRNNTYFRIDGLRNDLANMVVRVNLTLGDLHLKGAFERSLTDRDPSVLIYAPAFGQVEVLLQDVLYKVEGRYRIIKNRLTVELITSEINCNNILMMYVNQAIENHSVRLDKEHFGSFMSRLKTDLDKWLKDYFNDVMIFVELENIKNITELAKYDKEKESALEEYTDYAIGAIGTRIRSVGSGNVKLPVFTFKTTQGLQMKLYDGVLRGLDSMYRRSVATGLLQKTIYKIDTIVGFSDLKVVYKYEAVIPTGVPPLAGVLTLSANELTAHLALAMVNNPETIDLDIEFLDQMKPDSLTVEGAANIMISNFRHLLEHQIITVMSNTLIHGIRMLRKLPGCLPVLPGQTVSTKTPSSDISDEANVKRIAKEKKEKNPTTKKQKL